VTNRLNRFLLLGIFVLLAVLVARPYIERQRFSAVTPRAIEPRGNLADIERSTIALFDWVSPSVVQVAAKAGADDLSKPEGEETGVKTGTASSGILRVMW
jgi:hypothetical protein